MLCVFDDDGLNWMCMLYIEAIPNLCVTNTMVAYSSFLFNFSFVVLLCVCYCECMDVDDVGRVWVTCFSHCLIFIFFNSFQFVWMYVGMMMNKCWWAVLLEWKTRVSISNFFFQFFQFDVIQVIDGMVWYEGDMRTRLGWCKAKLMCVAQNTHGFSFSYFMYFM